MSNPTELKPYFFVLLAYLDQLRLFRYVLDDFLVIRRSLGYVERSTVDQGAICDKEVLVHVMEGLDAQLGRLRLIGSELVEDIHVLDRFLARSSSQTRAPAVPAVSSEQTSDEDLETIARCLRTLPPRFLHEACGQTCPAPKLMDSDSLSLIGLMHEDEIVSVLQDWSSNGVATLATPSPGGRQRRQRKRPDDVLQEIGDNAGSDVARLLDVCRYARRLRDVERCARATQLARGDSDAAGPRAKHTPLTEQLARLGRRDRDIASAFRVLRTIRRSVDHVLAMMPAGFPSVPRTQMEGRQFLHRVSQNVLRQGAERVVANSSLLLRLPGAGSEPMLVTVALTDRHDSFVEIDGRRLGVECPLYLIETPRHFAHVFHECAHGVLPPHDSISREGVFQPWLEGPIQRLLRVLWATCPEPSYRPHFSAAVGEVLADLLAMATVGPCYLFSLTIGALSRSKWGPDSEAFLDPLSRAEALLAAVDAVWKRGNDAALNEQLDPMRAMFDRLRRDTERICTALAASADKDDRTRARLRRWELQAAREYARFSVEVLSGVMREADRAEAAGGIEEGFSAVFRPYASGASEPAARASDALRADLEEMWKRCASYSATRRFLGDPTEVGARVLKWARLGARPVGIQWDEPKAAGLGAQDSLHLAWQVWMEEQRAVWDLLVDGGLPKREGALTAMAAGHYLEVAPILYTGLRLEALGREAGQSRSAWDWSYFGNGERITLAFFDAHWGRAEHGGAASPPPGSWYRPWPPGGDVEWFRCLGRYDFVQVIRPCAKLDPDLTAEETTRLAHLPLPHYVRRMDLELLPVFSQTAGGGEFGPSCPLVDKVEDLFPRPVQGGGAAPAVCLLQRFRLEPPQRGADTREVVRSLLARFASCDPDETKVRVRACFRAFDWADLALWIEAAEDPADAVDVVVRVNRAMAATEGDAAGIRPVLPYGELLTFYRWTKEVDDLATEIGVFEETVPDEKTALLAAIERLLEKQVTADSKGRSRLVLSFRLWLDRARSSSYVSSPCGLVPELVELLHKQSHYPKLTMRWAVGGEDVVGRLEVPRFTVDGGSGSIVQAHMSLAHMLIQRYIVLALGAYELTTHVTIGPPESVPVHGGPSDGPVQETQPVLAAVHSV